MKKIIVLLAISMLLMTGCTPKESILHGIFDATYEKPTSNTENSLEVKE